MGLSSFAETSDNIFKETNMRTDFDKIESGQWIMLFPNDSNPLHKSPIKAFYNEGYYYCEGTDPNEGPDYYFRDVGQYNHGYEFFE